MPQVFRLFISSTFSDFSREREILQQKVFPEIDLFCQSKGYSFQAIDLRWGVSEEAQLDQKTLELCLNEVRNCKSYPHPNFLIMSGNRYGWVPLPYHIEKEEFESISQIVKDDKEKEILQDWYRLDQNNLPASYVLKERTVPYDDSTEWEKVETKLRDILQDCIAKLKLPEEQKQKYFLSATEQEVNEGILHYSDYTKNQEKVIHNDPSLLDSDKEYVFSFLRSIENHNAFADSVFIEQDQSNVARFKQDIKTTLKKENIIELSTDLAEDNKLNEKYLIDFESRVLSFITGSIYMQINELNLLNKEKDQQKIHLKSKLHLFFGRLRDLEVIFEYVNNDNKNALIIHGKSGLGKSSLMAKAIESALVDSNRITVYRFIGASANASNTKDLWRSILNELSYGVEVHDNETFEQFSMKVRKYLLDVSQPTVIFIDAVDQLVNPDTFSWLPEILPANLKIIISALNDPDYEKDSRSYEVLSHISNNVYPLPKLNITLSFLNSLLKEHQRQLQPNQSSYVLTQYNKVCSPLYMKIVEQEIIHWKSGDNLNVSQNEQGEGTLVLANTQRGVISEFIKNLTSIHHHDEELVKKVMGYIYSATDGLTEKELITVLSMDKDLMTRVAPSTYHLNSSSQLPVVIWTRLKFHIMPFLSLKKVDGLETMHFFHREFNGAIERMFDVQAMHEELIHHILEKMSTDRVNFGDNRLGRLFIKLVLNFAFTYENVGSLSINIKKLTAKFDETWLKSCVAEINIHISEYYRAGQTKEAKSIYITIYENNQLFNLVEKKDAFLYLSAKVEQSLLDLSQQNKNEPVKLFEKALKGATDPKFKLSIKIEIAKTLRQIGEPEKALQMLKALLNQHLLEDSDIKADAQIQMGLCYFSAGEHKKAYDLYKDADKYLSAAGNMELKLYNLLGISRVVADMGAVQKGLDIAQRVNKEARQYGYQGFYIDSLNGIANANLLLKNYTVAIKYAYQALKLAKRQGNERLAYLMLGYLLEGYAGHYTSNVAKQGKLTKRANKVIKMIKSNAAKNGKKVVEEKVILDLVDKALAKWEGVLPIIKGG